MFLNWKDFCDLIVCNTWEIRILIRYIDRFVNGKKNRSIFISLIFSVKEESVTSIERWERCEEKVNGIVF